MLTPSQLELLAKAKTEWSPLPDTEILFEHDFEVLHWGEYIQVRLNTLPRQTRWLWRRTEKPTCN